MSCLYILHWREATAALAGPTSSKASNSYVDMTGIASAEAAAGGPSLETLVQAQLMCDACPIYEYSLVAK